MANILNQEDEQNKQKDLSAPMASGGLQSTNAGPSAAQTVQAKPQGSGSFTNLQKYLGANEKAGDQLNEGIRQKGEGYIDKVRQGINSAQGVQQGISGEKARIGQAGQLAQGIQTDAVNVAQNNLDDVTKLRLGQNQANQLAGQGNQAARDLSTNINPLDRFGQNLGSESGRFQVLQDTFGGAYKPNYNMGQRRLDQLFLQAGDDTQLNQLQNQIGQTVGSGNQNLSSLQKDLGRGIQDIRYGSDQAKSDILNTIGVFNPDAQGAFGSLYGDFGTEQAARNTELDNYLKTARGQFGQGQLSQSTANMLGFTGKENVSDLDLIKYANDNIQRGDKEVTFADVAGRKDLQNRLNALSQLSGTQTSDYDLGTYDPGKDILFDANRFATDTASQRQTYEDRFFDKKLGNLFAPQNIGSDYIKGVSDINNYLTKDNKVIDEILREGSSSGSYSAPYSVSQDPRTRQQLQTASDAITARTAAYSPNNATANQFSQLLSLFDKQRNRNFGITPDSPNDLESGGNFNVI